MARVAAGVARAYDRFEKKVLTKKQKAKKHLNKKQMKNIQEVNNSEQSPAKKSHERELIPFVHFLKEENRNDTKSVKCHAITGTVSKAH